MDAKQIDDVVDLVYRIRLEDECRTNVERMLAKDQEKPLDVGKKLRGRSKSYRGAVLATLQAVGLIEPSPQLNYLIEKGLAGQFPIVTK